MCICVGVCRYIYFELMTQFFIPNSLSLSLPLLLSTFSTAIPARHLLVCQNWPFYSCDDDDNIEKKKGNGWFRRDEFAAWHLIFFSLWDVLVSSKQLWACHVKCHKHGLLVLPMFLLVKNGTKRETLLLANYKKTCRKWRTFLQVMTLLYPVCHLFIIHTFIHRTKLPESHGDVLWNGQGSLMKRESIKVIAKLQCFMRHILYSFFVA